MSRHVGSSTFVVKIRDVAEVINTLFRFVQDALRLPNSARHAGEIRVVSLVCDPIAFNVSNFTYFGRAYWLRTDWRSTRPRWGLIH